MATVTTVALSSDDITGVGIGVIVALVILGLLIGAIVTKLVVRAALALVVVALAIVVWQQRGHVQDEINSRVCNQDVTFFGIHVDPPDSVTSCATKS